MQCSKCGTTENVVESQRDSLRICNKCPVGQCRTCQRTYTIDERGVSKCFCGEEDICFSCREKNLFPSPVTCRFCINPYEFNICHDPKCKELLENYLLSTREVCSFCHDTTRCLHNMLTIGSEEDPFSNRNSVVCMYKKTPTSDWCGKWICYKCVRSSMGLEKFYSDGQGGFFCYEHRHDRDPPKQVTTEGKSQVQLNCTWNRNGL